MKLMLLAALTLLVITQPPSKTARDWNAEAVKAYQAKDYKTFLAAERRALELEPSNPRYAYNVACGESLTGNTKEAVRLLVQLTDRKIDLGAEKDEDLAAARQTPGWREFTARLQTLRQPIIRSVKAFEIPDSEIMAVGLAVDHTTGDTYIASIRQRKILRRDPAGAFSDFIQPAQDGFLGGAALAIDAPRDLIYASTSAVPFMRDYRKQDSGKSGVYAFDLKTGKTARKAMLAPDGKQHFLNALAIDHKGNVYVSDSLNSGIYRLPRGKDDLETFIKPSVFEASQGLAFSDDEHTLYVADFVDGMWALDMVSKNRHHLEPPLGSWLFGLDGIARVPDGFVCVQLQVQPNRVLHLKLDNKREKIASVDVLEMNHPSYNEPIQGTLDGDSFLYVANSQIGLGNGETGAYEAEKARPTVVLRLPLTKTR